MSRVPVKKRPKNSVEPDVRKRKAVKKKKPKRISEPKASWVALGIDLSTVSIAGAAYGYDSVLKKEKGPVFSAVRWTREDDYFARMSMLAQGHEFVTDLIWQLKMLAEPADVYIAIEEPWPYGMEKKLQSQTLKQQAQMSGCFIGSLLKWGFQNIHEIHNYWWKGVIADDLGITIHWSKYGKGIEGKMRAKEWGVNFIGAPEWPDMISSKHGLIPKPETSKAKVQQPDDRYDALAMSRWMRNEIIKGQD